MGHSFYRDGLSSQRLQRSDNSTTAASIANAALEKKYPFVLRVGIFVGAASAMWLLVILSLNYALGSSTEVFKEVLAFINLISEIMFR